MLGTGNGITLNLFNTCFVIQNENGNFLVDTGGSIEIIKRLELANIDYESIKHIFISHSDSDHILGLFWFFKKMGFKAMSGLINEKINVYCNDKVHEAIKGVAKYIFPDKLANDIFNVVNFVILNDNDTYTINGVNYTFFDARAKKVKLFGFEAIINNQKIAFLGDEPIDSSLYDRIRGCDYVMHEAFCLDSEDYIFHATKIHHSTVKNVSKIMESLNVKNLILYHTEETHVNKKELYTKESQLYFSGKVIVPNDLEAIVIE